ncbi:hypothetical protein M0804_015115 [Polistes exclamans]|nr:hypothetical protein M0804_015115 [Polistes exclamans]
MHFLSHYSELGPGLLPQALNSVSVTDAGPPAERKGRRLIDDVPLKGLTTLQLANHPLWSAGEDFCGFRGFEHTRTPVDSFVTISRIPNLSRSSSPRLVQTRQPSFTPLEGNTYLKTENKRLKRELEYLRGAVAALCNQACSMHALIKLREITKAVPKFDGHNISVSPFARVGRLKRSVERKIKEESLDAFICGLLSDYRTALRFERYIDFSLALICLLRIDKQIKDEARRNASPTFRSRVANVGPIKDITVCRHCSKQGHQEDNCWRKNKHNDLNSSNRNSPDSPKSPPKSGKRRNNRCNYCKNMGYWKHKCRKLKFHDEKRKKQNQGNNEKLTGTVTLMIDTGAEINLIKDNVLRKTTKTIATKTVQLTGISPDRHTTLGTAKIHIFGEDITFYLVEENFPIQSNGILGTEFLQSKSATIDSINGCLKFRQWPKDNSVVLRKYLRSVTNITNLLLLCREHQSQRGIYPSFATSTWSLRW